MPEIQISIGFPVFLFAKPAPYLNLSVVCFVISGYVKTFGLNPEGSGILSRHLSATVEFQELILAPQWRKGWSQARLSVDERMKDFGALHLGRIRGEQAGRYWCFIGRYFCLS